MINLCANGRHVIRLEGKEIAYPGVVHLEYGATTFSQKKMGELFYSSKLNANSGQMFLEYEYTPTSSGMLPKGARITTIASNPVEHGSSPGGDACYLTAGFGDVPFLQQGINYMAEPTYAVDDHVAGTAPPTPIDRASTITRTTSPIFCQGPVLHIHERPPVTVAAGVNINPWHHTGLTSGDVVMCAPYTDLIHAGTPFGGVSRDVVFTSQTYLMKAPLGMNKLRDKIVSYGWVPGLYDLGAQYIDDLADFILSMCQKSGAVYCDPQYGYTTPEEMKIYGCAMLLRVKRMRATATTNLGSSHVATYSPWKAIPGMKSRTRNGDSTVASWITQTPY